MLDAETYDVAGDTQRAISLRAYVRARGSVRLDVLGLKERNPLTAVFFCIETKSKSFASFP